MGDDIVLSAGVRQNLLSLQRTSDLMSRTQDRLATGKKVNSALDNPINFFTAAGLTNRANDLSALLDGVSNAVKTLGAADNGITALKSLLQTAQATARQALQNNASTGRFTGTVANLTGASSFAVTATKTITISDGTTTATVTSGGTVTAQNILDAVNSTVGLNIRASLTSDGKIQFEATGTNTIVIGGTASGAELAQFGLTAGTTAAGTLNTARTNFASQFNQLLSQIDKQAQDASFNGVNLIYGSSLKVIFNEQQSSFLTITGVKFDSSGLGLGNASNNFQTDYDINTALNQLQTAQNTLANQASNFGASLSIVQTRQNFLNQMINTLQSGADNLTLADTNEEGANMLALQTRQQLSTTALSLAAQAQQNVLKLFGG